MERRVSPLSTKAHRLSLLSCVKVWCAANRAPSADPLTSTEDEHQQHVHKHQNRDHSKHRASLDIQGHGAALQADAEMRSQVSGGIQLSTASRHVLKANKREAVRRLIAAAELPSGEWGPAERRAVRLRGGPVLILRLPASAITYSRGRGTASPSLTPHIDH
ncbi:hypothetical protein NQZ68_040419 [Dissostichus eleginoides]|nr:hypothetical protein NQZ68_040419 [Dissostichus eleginoides]